MWYLLIFVLVSSLSLLFFFFFHGRGISTSMHNFLYVHPSENISNGLVSLVLGGNNYHSWSRSMETVLSAKKISLISWMRLWSNLGKMIKCIWLGRGAIKW